MAILSASIALDEDFKSIDGKVYKAATVSRVEADGIVLRTKAGISKVYFIELPKDVQERFHHSPPEIIAAQREPEPIKVEAKQDAPPQPDAGSWSAALGVSAAFLRLFAVGAVTVTGLLLAFIRSRFS